MDNHKKEYKLLNNKKIAFIICANCDMELEECCFYLNNLIIPSGGYEIDILTVTQANSMAEGYNEGMESSDAKYKIYLHQDVFIINKYFIEDMLEVFESDDEVGMFGNDREKDTE